MIMLHIPSDHILNFLLDSKEEQGSKFTVEVSSVHEPVLQFWTFPYGRVQNYSKGECSVFVVTHLGMRRT